MWTRGEGEADRMLVVGICKLEDFSVGFREWHLIFTSEPVGRSESTDHIRPYNDLEIVALEAR